MPTCARPGGVSYLGATLAALDRAGADGVARCVLVDGPELPEVPAGWELLPGQPRRIGGTLQLWRAFRLAAERSAERVLYCEDDITPCQNAIRYLLTLQIPEDVAFIDARVLREDLQGAPGLRRVELTQRRRPYWGTQALILPLRTCEWLIGRDPLSLPIGDHEKHGDLILGELAGRSPWPRYGAHLPRLVRHDGVVSSAHDGVSRPATAGWPGEAFDAMTIQATSAGAGR